MDQPLSTRFRFWTPPPGHTVTVGPNREKVPILSIPLPVSSELPTDEPPSDNAIGEAIYDYLRQFPDCPHNREYAEILRDAYPHYLADLGSQIVMLDHKDVEAPYVKRKITSMQILLLLDPENRGLQRQLGRSLYELALMFPELPDCRRHLTRAMRHLTAAGDDATTLNDLARIDYLLGDYPKAIARWQRVADMVGDPDTRKALLDQVERLRRAGEPESPLIDDLEAIGEAMQALGAGDIVRAKMILENLEAEGRIPEEFPNPEFYYMIGVCRERTGDAAGAFGAYDAALRIDPGHEPAREARDRIAGGTA